MKSLRNAGKEIHEDQPHVPGSMLVLTTPKHSTKNGLLGQGL
jgi:hypothetical protein